MKYNRKICHQIHKTSGYIKNKIITKSSQLFGTFSNNAHTLSSNAFFIQNMKLLSQYISSSSFICKMLFKFETLNANFGREPQENTKEKKH